MKYTQQYDGEWFAPKMSGWKMGCCDCGLVHVVNFKVVKGELYMMATRDNRATAQKRRNRKKREVQC